MARTVSLAHLSMIDIDPLELVDAAAAGGFDAVGMRISAPWHSPLNWQVVGNSAMIRDLRRRLADTGVGVHDVESFSLTGEVDVERFRPAIETGAELGAKLLLTAGNDPDFERLSDNLAKLCDIAAENGLGVSFEFIPYCAVSDLAGAREAVRKVAKPNAGLLLDALHLSRSRGKPADLASCSPGEVSLLHLCDAVETIPDFDNLPDEARRKRLPPGAGVLPLLDILRWADPTTPIGVEAPTEAFSALPAPQRAIRLGRATRDLLSQI